MKSIHECDQHEKMLRALLVIDAMTFFLDTIMCSEPRTPVERFVHDVYSIAHSAHGTCSGCGTDSCSLEVIEKNATLLRNANIMDLDKVIREIEEGKRPHRHDPNRIPWCDPQPPPDGG